eukprot:TRINITY_DN1342_c0_g1_i4.p1 TRINITY_DN1342_c0_g1~~TRINITY_DN1342_c0_g1_i4.p1  ORF type:complete len:126 (+),score=2.20 TRINITY_DN1342_c0_g1_i4:433-810(+)
MLKKVNVDTTNSVRLSRERSNLCPYAFIVVGAVLLSRDQKLHCLDERGFPTATDLTDEWRRVFSTLMSWMVKLTWRRSTHRVLVSPGSPTLPLYFGASSRQSPAARARERVWGVTYDVYAYQAYR